MININKKYCQILLDKYEDDLYLIKNYNVWRDICYYCKLSELQLEKYLDRLDWLIVSSTSDLSESFIEKYYNKVYWPYVSIFQKLSEDFIVKWRDYIYVSALLNRNFKISKEDREKISERLKHENYY